MKRRRGGSWHHTGKEMLSGWFLIFISGSSSEIIFRGKVMNVLCKKEVTSEARGGLAGCFWKVIPFTGDPCNKAILPLMLFSICFFFFHLFFLILAAARNTLIWGKAPHTHTDFPFLLSEPRRRKWHGRQKLKPSVLQSWRLWEGQKCLDTEIQL